jgi:hypothetical protein
MESEPIDNSVQETITTTSSTSEKKQGRPSSSRPKSTTADHWIRYVLISIRNHWLMAAPVLASRFLSSYSSLAGTTNNRNSVSSIVHQLLAPNTVQSYHKLTDYVLVAVSVWLIVEKFYLIKRGVQRPPVGNTLFTFLIRNHWLVLSIWILGSLYLRNKSVSLLGFNNVQQFNTYSDLILLLLGLLLVYIKLICLLKIETIQRQFMPIIKMEDNGTKIKEE